MALPGLRLHGSSIVRQAIIRKLSSTSSKQNFLLLPPIKSSAGDPPAGVATIQPGV
jgi:hypothetical protein